MPTRTTTTASEPRKARSYVQHNNPSAAFTPQITHYTASPSSLGTNRSPQFLPARHVTHQPANSPANASKAKRIPKPPFSPKAQPGQRNADFQREIPPIALAAASSSDTTQANRPSLLETIKTEIEPTRIQTKLEELQQEITTDTTPSEKDEITKLCEELIDKNISPNITKEALLIRYLLTGTPYYILKAEGRPQVLGTGNQGIVYDGLFLDTRSNTVHPCAIKTQKTANNTSQQKKLLIKRFNTENTVLRKLNDANTPNVMKLFYSSFIEGGDQEPCVTFQVFEKIEGPTLWNLFLKIFEERKIGKEELFNQLIESKAIHRWTNEIKMAIEAMHSLGITHFDLKLENVMLAKITPTGSNDWSNLKAIIIDFGYADWEDNPTFDTAVRGTPRYIHPDIATAWQTQTPLTFQHGMNSDKRALDIITYELYTNRLPFHFPEATQEQTMRNIISGTYMTTGQISKIPETIRTDLLRRLGIENTTTQQAPHQ